MAEARSAATRPARQAANLLGALALALSHRVEGAVTEAAGLTEGDAVALSTLHHFLESPRVDLIAQVMGLTSSGTVRLVNRLEEAGLRAPSDRRGRARDRGRNEASGRRRAQAVTRARTQVLNQALSTLTPSERQQLAELAGKILANLIRPPGATRWTCRLCDVVGCGRPNGHCPVYEAAKARYGDANAH